MLDARAKVILMSTILMSPTEKEVIDTVELRTKRGAVKRLSGDRLKLLSADVMAAVANKFDGDKLAGLLDELCSAQVVTNGGRQVPDNRTRLAAVTLVLAYLVGRPVERQEIVSVNLDADSMTGLRERLRSSPAMRETLAGLLAEVEADPTTSSMPPGPTVEIHDAKAENH